MLKIEIMTSGAAYRDEDYKLDSYELCRNLKEITEKLENGYTHGIVMDINGNKSGNWELD